MKIRKIMLGMLLCATVMLSGCVSMVAAEGGLQTLEQQADGQEQVADAGEMQVPRNVILIIGDGMGVP